ncbi:MAG TPA: large conductance mechanosensitive channel protein MscL, partial [Chloroflexota bacterium]|nr:large conductance mechanosensitive channel protein MscL [Chloroflexota bacterium]
MGGFQKFLLRGNVVDLAVAVVIGAAFGAVVQAAVKDLITPLIGAFGGLPDFSAWFFTVNGSKFLIGDFINNVVSFVVIAAVVYYLVVLPVQRLMDRFKPDEPQPAPATRECPE